MLNTEVEVALDLDRLGLDSGITANVSYSTFLRLSILTCEMVSTLTTSTAIQIRREHR